MASAVAPPESLYFSAAASALLRVGLEMRVVGDECGRRRPELGQAHLIDEGGRGEHDGVGFDQLAVHSDHEATARLVST